MFVGKSSFAETSFASGKYFAKIPVQQDLDTEIYFKLYDQGNPEVPYDQPWELADQTLVLIDKDENEDGQQDDLSIELTASGEVPKYKVEFILQDGDITATQTDDTPLVQYVSRGSDAEPPAVTVPAGYEAQPWENQENIYTDVTQQTTVRICIDFKSEEKQCHSADTSSDWKIDQQELLRVIDLYKSSAYYLKNVGEESIDGYVKDAAKGTQPNENWHAADTNKNWKIEQSELLRVIDLYKAKGYTTEEGTVDGYKKVSE